jgi:hypothetical protein
MYSAADYVKMLIIYGECGNVDNLRRMWKLSKSTCSIFKSISATILYKFVGWSIRELCGMSSIEISLHVS